MFCRECGKSIEADARFCRFCGKAQADPVPGGTPVRTSTPARSHASSPGIEARLAEIFPRHHLQDEFMHVGSIAAFLMALIGFIVGFFVAYNWLGTNFLLASIALLLFLILRESTLSHIRVGDGGSRSHTGGGTRYQAGRRSTTGSEGPAEAANADSSPPSAATNRPPATPR